MSQSTYFVLMLLIAVVGMLVRAYFDWKNYQRNSQYHKEEEKDQTKDRPSLPSSSDNSKQQEEDDDEKVA
jgi:hypothetical protein